MFFDNQNILINIENLTSFKNWDWLTEPTESFKELCKQRALQIRQSYDYVIVYHSGGSDSTTVLNSFLDNNIHVDEIITCYYENVNSPNVDGKKSIFDLKQKNFKGIYNRVNITFDSLVNYYKKENLLEDGSNIQFAHFMPAIQRYNIKYLEQYGFAKPMNRKEKTAHVVGVGEPKIVRKENKFYSRLDLKICFMASSFHENTYFFTTNDFPKLHIKQSYMVAKDMKENNKYVSNIKRMKRLIRDVYNPLISPTPIMFGDVKNKLNNIEPYSDIHVLLNSYSKEDDKFKDLYINSSLKDSFKRLNNINNYTNKSYIDCLLNI